MASDARQAAREFSAHANALLVEAKRKCAETPDCDIEHWMELAKARGMTWVEGLTWTVTILKK